MALKLTLHEGYKAPDVLNTGIVDRRSAHLQLIQRRLDKLTIDYRGNEVQPYDFYVRFMNIAVSMPLNMSINIHCNRFAFLNVCMDTQFDIHQFLDDLYKYSHGQLAMRVGFRQ